MVTRAVTGPRETRLGSILTTLPQRVDLYFKVRRGRKLLWKCIFAFTGFYTANVLSLTFGVLGINDVVAGAFCVAFSEIVTRSYYRKSKPGKYWDFLNWFKLGLTTRSPRMRQARVVISSSRRATTTRAASRVRAASFATQ